MGYVDKKIAMQYLANSEKLFNNLKNNFIRSYSNINEVLLNHYNNKDYPAIRQIVHTIKGITLNIGSQVLYDDAVDVLKEYEKDGLINLAHLNRFIDTLEYVINELKLL